MTFPAQGARAWAVAISVFLTALISFLSSPNWALALLITGVVCFMILQYFQIQECKRERAMYQTDKQRLEQSIGFIYILAQTRAGGRRSAMPPLDKFLGTETATILRDVRELMAEEARQSGHEPRAGDIQT